MAVELGRVVVVELGRLAEVVAPVRVLVVVDGLLVVVVAPVLPEVPGVGRTLLLVGLFGQGLQSPFQIIRFIGWNYDGKSLLHARLIVRRIRAVRVVGIHDRLFR